MSELGEIGAIYEDRRTKKQGKLVERDEKFKTLLMETSDGKSFNITFGGFKNNWRKVDEPEQTVEEAMKEIPVPEPIKKEKPVKKVEEKSEEVNPVYAEALKKVVEYVESFNSSKLNVRPNFDTNMISVKLCTKKCLEIFRKPRNKYYTIACKDNVAQFVDKLEFIDGVKFYPTRKPLNYAFLVDVDKFDTLLSCLRPEIMNLISEEIEEGE